MEIVQNVLAIIGLFSLLVTVIRIIWVFFVTNFEWVDCVQVKCLPSEKDQQLSDSVFEITESGECIFPVIYSLDQTENTQSFLFRPNSTIIKKMKLYSVHYDLDTRKEKYTPIKTFCNISPYNPLIIQCSFSEILPQYCISWSGDYGIKMKYTFQANGRDGNADTYGMSCKIGVLQKIRRIIGLK